jgi:hypothetical protein
MDKETVKNMLKGRSCDNCKFKLCDPTTATNVIISAGSNYSATAKIEYVETCDVLGTLPKKRCCKFWKQMMAYYTTYGNTTTTATTTALPITTTTGSYAITSSVYNQLTGGGNYTSSAYSGTPPNSTS